MTAETLHDALTLLPADLVAAADKRRSRKKAPLHWQRWAAMAACFALVFCVGSFAMLVMAPKGSSKSEADMESALREELTAEAPAAAAPMDTMAASENSITGSADRSPAEESLAAPPLLPQGFVDAQWFETPYGTAVEVGSEPCVTLASDAETFNAYLTRRDFQDMSSLQVLTPYQDEGWFDQYDLVLIRLPLVTEAKLLDIRETAEGWTVLLPQQTTGVPVLSYHLVLTVEKGLVPDPNALTVTFQ